MLFKDKSVFSSLKHYVITPVGLNNDHTLHHSVWIMFDMRKIHYRKLDIDRVCTSNTNKTKMNGQSRKTIGAKPIYIINRRPSKTLPSFAAKTTASNYEIQSVGEEITEHLYLTTLKVEIFWKLLFSLNETFKRTGLFWCVIKLCNFFHVKIEAKKKKTFSLFCWWSNWKMEKMKVYSNARLTFVVDSKICVCVRKTRRKNDMWILSSLSHFLRPCFISC